MQAFHSIPLRECKHFTLFGRFTTMRAKRMSKQEQLELILECRQSGLSDYHWCKLHEIKPGTFYNWIRRLRENGAVIPDSSPFSPPLSTPLQEVVPLTFSTEPDKPATQREVTSAITSKSEPLSLHSVEILIGNATVRFFNHTEQSLLKRTLDCLGGHLYAG